MDKKCITFFMVSDRKGVTRKFVISSAWLKVISSLVVIGMILVSVALLDYFSLIVQTSKNQRLQIQNTHIKEQVAFLEDKLGILEGEMEYFRWFITKLKIIIAPSSKNNDFNLTANSLHQGGIGLIENENLSNLQRNLASNRPPLQDTDALFFKSAPLNVNQGELAKEAHKDYALLNIRLDQAIGQAKLQKQSGLELWEWLSKRQSLLQATPSILPTKGWITSAFGYRISPYTQKPTFHQGLDIAAMHGTPVRATGDGVVTYTGYDAGYGKLISIDHGYDIVTRYGHNSQVFVVMGQKVKRGEVIASVGNTGRTTGPHLHYEVRLNDMPVNPQSYILSD